jgi:hypothetical protein
MRRWCAGLLLWPLAAVAAPTAEEFAQAFPVRGAVDGQVVEVPLDARVYRAATTSSLADLRVFDAEGRIVAHVLLPGHGDAALPAQLDVPVFELPAGPPGTLAASRIELSDGGAILSIQRVEGSPPTTGPRTWLLDLSGLERPVAALALDWTLAGRSGLLATVTLAASQDLDRWSQVPVRGVVADLRRDDASLRRDTLELPATRARYLKLSLQGPPDLRITRVRARPAPVASAPSAWVRVAPSRASGDAGAWLYDLGGPLPVDAVRLAADEGAQFFTTTVRSAPSADGPFEAPIELVLQRFDTSSAPPVSSRLQVRDRRWLQLDPGTGAPVEPVPLEVRYEPARLRFVATGTPPWRLAAGQRGLERPDDPGAEVLRSLPAADDGGPEVIDARLGDPVEMAGERARRPGPSGDLVFWAVILAGVLVLALMLRHLLREMRDSPDA